ncbi:MAG: 30S ribosomal protein S9 [Candidatus Vogelbacteria bacterium]|nr:30S ribosomal protein S9 [Candidatus Vogelbacteria bacterium]
MSTEIKTKKTAVKSVSYVEATGRRKTSVARVRISAAKNSTYKCNDRSIQEYFPTEAARTIIQAPLKTATPSENYEISIHVRGGGMMSQAEAVRHGIARALSKADEGLRKPLKSAKFLRRDSRAKERRKFGLKKARKAPQWSKR